MRRKLIQGQPEAFAQAYAEAVGKLDLAESLAGVGHWEFDFTTRHVRWSPEVYRIYGVSPETFDPALDSVLGAYHPDDRDALFALIARAESHGEGYEFKFRLNRISDGDERTVVAKAVVRRDVDDKPALLFGVFQDVTEVEADKRRIQDSEASYRLLADYSTDIIVRFGPDGFVRYVSPACRILGYTPEDLLGRPVLELVAPDHLGQSEAILKGLFEGAAVDPSIRRLHKAVRRDGGEVWLEGRPSAVLNAAGDVVEIITCLRDVSIHRAIEVALAERELRYRQLTENANDMVTEISSEGRFTYVSPAVETLTGYVPGEVVGRIATDFIDPLDQARVGKAFSAATRKNVPMGWTIEYRVRTKDGRTIWVEARPSFSAAASGSGVVTDVIRDITAAKKLQTELIAAREEALAATAAKSEFLANMSHELRTPLTSILGFAGLLHPLLEGAGEADRYSARIADAGRALLTTVNDILDFSKLEAGQVEIEVRPVDVTRLVREAVDLLTPQAEAKRLVLGIDTRDSPAEARMLDDTRIRQVLLNLVSNAVKFTGAGSVDISVSQRGSDRIRIEVSDTGSGIAPDRLERLFKRFSQVDASTTRTHGGTGLGLAICKGLVEAMGGEIGVHSRLGEGSTFYFELPADRADPSMSSAQVAPAPIIGDFAGLRLLVVDDNPANRELVRLLAEAVGMEVSEADCGEAGISIAHDRPFDAILMDLRMPGMDGHTALGVIRRGGPNAQTPILAFSANVDITGDTSRTLAAFDGAIAKPIMPALFFEGIRLALCDQLQDREAAHG